MVVGPGLFMVTFPSLSHLFVYLFIGSIVHLLCNQSRLPSASCRVLGRDMTSSLPLGTPDRHVIGNYQVEPAVKGAVGPEVGGTPGSLGNQNQLHKGTNWRNKQERAGLGNISQAQKPAREDGISAMLGGAGTGGV